MITKIAISKLEPHPDNPRLFLRESVVAAIAAQLTDKGEFEERHALHTRQLDSGHYQIISGHQRFEAAKQAGLKQVPCHVIEMNDEEALREALLSNAQSDLTPLEIGLHVLKIVGNGNKGGRGIKGGIREYARGMGANEKTMQDWIAAAQVASKLPDQSGSLIDYTTNLSIIHRCPESDWADLVKRMLAAPGGFVPTALHEFNFRPGLQHVGLDFDVGCDFVAQRVQLGL